MNAQSILAALREGEALDAASLRWFADGLASGDVSDAQAGAFAMGVCQRGLSEGERVALTAAMRDSGETMTWSLDGPILDKHSTGGIGDCVSLLLAPALAACGAFVPMISGRGLGHTGGTLDKLEAIPGLSTEIGHNTFRKIVGEVGTAIVSASDRIAPADRRLYSVRDNTSTVKSNDLITASILSKKLAAGLHGLVLDVKIGSGAFMKTMEEAEELAEALVATANGAGCATAALITDMSEPLAPAMGNALEVMEVMEVLTEGTTDGDLWDVTRALGAMLLTLSGLAESPAIAEDAMDATLESGAAAEVFGHMVAEMGGPMDFVERWRDRLPAAPVVMEVAAPHAGFIRAMDGEALGRAVVALGGGRMEQGAKINPSVGLCDILKIGDPVSRGASMLTVHAASEAEAERAAHAVSKAIEIGEAPEVQPPLVHRRIG